MNRRLSLLVGIGVVLILLGSFMLYRQIHQNSVETPPRTDTTLNLGITYVPVTPKLASYYNLDVDFGALVTDVVHNGPAALAGIQKGDVILSFNGVRVEDGTSLYGMMVACPMGNEIELELWRSKSIRKVNLVHTGE
ncbi:MAG: PDZ domain-containing protein [Chloroflexi bacterium]|nr:PDZ domain-containing protein [Chloroflexota bacterium]